MSTIASAPTATLYAPYRDTLRRYDGATVADGVQVYRPPLNADKAFSMTIIKAVGGLGRDEDGSARITLVIYHCFPPHADTWFFQFTGSSEEPTPLFWVHPALGIRTGDSLEDSLELNLSLAAELLETLMNARFGDSNPD